MLSDRPATPYSLIKKLVMAQPSVERYSKRKRVEITYYESDTDDSVADVIDEPDVECFAKKVSTSLACSIKPRWLDL